MPPDLSRHALVWLKVEAPWVALADCSTHRLRAWLSARRPAVVARRQGDEPNGFLRLGVALPPSGGKQRLSFAAPPSSIERSRGPLSLSDIMETRPAGWEEALRSLIAVTRAIAIQPLVYGSFAWQALTGERYVNANSDIDLLWRPGDTAQIDALIAAMIRWEHATCRRADGEVLLPNGDAVCWRELARGGARLLVKSKSSVALRGRLELLTGFA